MRYLFSNLWLLILAILSALVIIGPELGMIAAISVIGIPLAIAYWAIPALFMVLLIIRILYLFLPLQGAAALLLAIAACAVLLAVPPFLINGKIKSSAYAYVAQDHNELMLPITAKSIAVRRALRFDKATTRCDGFCMHALLTGTAEKVLVVDTKTIDQPINLDELAEEFSLEKRSICPQMQLKSGYHDLDLRTANKTRERSASPLEEMNLRISNGECLVSRQTTLAAADIIISEGRIHAQARRALNSGFSLTTDAVTADRITIHDNSRKNGSVAEIYRWTGVQYSPLGLFLLPAPQFIYAFEMRMGWWREGGRINIPTKFYEKTDWEGFLTKTLGFNLALDGVKSAEGIQIKMKSVLAEHRPPTRDEWALFSTYFDRIGIGANTSISKADFDVALAMLQRSDYPPVPRLYNVSRFAEKNASPEEFGLLAEALFKRMATGQTWANELDVDLPENIKQLSVGINSLPDAALQPHFDRLAILASDPAVQVHGYQTLQKLHLFGDRAVPTLLGLMNKGLSGGDKFFRDNTYQHPYLAGIGGLCIAGENAASALPELKRMFEAANVPLFSSYGRLYVATLVRMGEDPEKLWPQFSAANSNQTRKNYDATIRRALSKKPDCSF